MPVPVQVAFKPLTKPEVGVNGYVEPTIGKSEVLKKGSAPFKARTLDSDIRVDHDVEITVRDGCRLYADVFRPTGDEKVPVIISWSPYGKKYSALDMIFNVCVWACCLKREDVSGLEKFEGLDPAWWVNQGYAIANVDARGAGDSDGDAVCMGAQEGEDAHDVIEALAKLPWCNGSVGMAGNSYLAIMQWHAAAQKPPSLKAIAPWEGCGDIFREQFCRGGWFTMSNFDLITTLVIKGKHGVEDFAEMYRRSPIANAYWNDKRVDFSKIDIPVFITGSDLSQIHTMGAVRGWMELKSDKKWIKWCGHQEWFELYGERESYPELKKYFDKYLKGIDNDWEKTPRVRWATLQYDQGRVEENIELADFPSPNTDYRSLYLGSDGSLLDALPSAGTTSHNSEDRWSISKFRYTFDKPTRILGIPKAELYMSCDALDDMVVFVQLRKLDKTGKELSHLQFPIERTPVKSVEEMSEKERISLTLHNGAMGILRASHRKIDSTRSMHSQFPFHPHDEAQLIPKGEVVKLEIGIWAMGVDYQAGESIQFDVLGQYPGFTEVTAFSKPRPDSEKNKGRHTVHFGGDYPSRVILPFVEL
ncbi:PepX-C domain-containing protein [Fusarium falciforme]|uniref:PepX-C domain-containing protein n=1 Tax=Fusarium falciforme TaxID=195108 RepID=UPI002301D84A|nr:PepX-C domain-containing protein [Fusarium falciforme]WAO96415.1 PepX-C domain-containing protein [Fusarium falciforme]